MAFPSISGTVTGGDFAATDGTNLQTASANWVRRGAANSDIVTATGQGKVSASTYADYGYHVNPGSNEVEGYFTIATKLTGNRANGIWIGVAAGPAPGSSDSDIDGYQIEIDTSTTVADLVEVYKKTDGATIATLASSTATTFAAGDKFGFRISTVGGNRLIEVFRYTAGAWNQTPIVSVTDSTTPYTTVAAFLFGMTDSAAGPGRIDDLVLGATSTAGANISPSPLVGVGSLVVGVSAGVTYMDAGATVTALSGDVTANYPVGVGAPLVDDIIICDVSARDNVSLTFPAGWTKKAEANNGTGLRQTIAYHRRAGGESETSVAITHTAGAQIIARVHVVRGAVGSGDPFEAATGPTTVTAGTTGTFPSVTTLTAGDLLFYALAYQEDYLTAPTITNAQGLTLTERDLTEVA